MSKPKKYRKVLHVAHEGTRTFDAKICKAGNSLVVTIPLPTVERLDLKEGDLLEVTIKK